MRLLLTLVTLAALVVPTAGADDEKFTSKKGKFTAVFPGGEPTENEKDTGQLTLTTIQSAARGRVFIVMYTDLPAEADNIPAKTHFDNFESGFLKGAKFKSVASFDTTFGKAKLPAREVLAKNDGTMLRAVMILKDRRLYVLVSGGPDDFTTSKEAFGFFETFEITR